MSAETSRENGKKGGRPEGALAKMSKRKANELAAADRTPLDVMVDNMNFWWDKAKDLGTIVEEQVARVQTMENPEEARAALAEISKTATHFLAARENAQKCAVEAAPYVHPRFQSISVSKHTTKTTITMVMNKPIDNLTADYRADGSADVIPLERIAS